MQMCQHCSRVVDTTHEPVADYRSELQAGAEALCVARPFHSERYSGQAPKPQGVSKG